MAQENRFGRTFNVLHVDDNPQYMRLVEKFLEKNPLDFNILKCEDPEKVLEIIEEENIDCVLSDFEMGEMDGIELLKQVRKKYRDLPFVMLTNNGDESVASKAISEGVTDYIPKKEGTKRHSLVAKRLEDAILSKKTQKEKKRVLERVSDAFFGLDDDWNFTYVNDWALEVLGRDEEELIGSNIWEEFPEARGSLFQEKYEEAMNLQKSVQFKEYYPPLDKWFRVHAYPSETGLSVYFRDITDEIRREKDLKRYEEFVQNSREILTVLDEDGVITYAGSSVEEVLGYMKEDIEGKNAFELIHPNDREKVRSAFKKMVEDGVTDDGVEYRLRAVDGSWIWMESFGDRNAYGGMEGYVINSRNIEDRKTQDLTKKIIETIPVGIIVTDGEGSVVTCNSHLAEMLGFESNVVGEDPCKKVELEDEEGNKIPMKEYPIKRVIRSGEPVYNFEAKVSNIDKDLWITNDAVMVNIDGEEFVVESIKDITAEKKERREKDGRLEDFGDIVSHDLRNPLNVAKGYLDLAKDSGDREDFKRVENSLDKMSDIISGLTVMTMSAEDLEKKDIELEEVFRETMGYVDEELEYNVEDFTVNANRESLVRLLGNLVSNSINHNSGEVSVEIGSLEDGFYYQDDGEGIPEEEREKVFEYGYSTEDSDGLGLAIVKRVSTINGWSLDLKESPEGGARFEFRLKY